MTRCEATTSASNGVSNREAQTPPIIPLTRQPPRLHSDNIRYLNDYGTSDAGSDSDSGAHPRLQTGQTEAKDCIRRRLLTRARGMFRQNSRYRDVSDRPPTPWVQHQPDPEEQTGMQERAVAGVSVPSVRRFDAVGARHTWPVLPPAVGTQTRPIELTGNLGTLSTRGGRGNDTVGDQSVPSRENADQALGSLRWEFHHAPENPEHTLADSDRPGAAHRTSLADEGLTGLEYYSVAAYADMPHHVRAESPDTPVTPVTPPPPYENTGHQPPQQTYGGLEVLQSPVLLPSVRLTELYHSQYGQFGLFAALSSAVDSEWVDGIISADGALAVYRNVSRSLPDEAEAIIHVRGTAIRPPPASAMFGFRGASSLIIRRSGGASQWIPIDDSTRMEVTVDTALIPYESLDEATRW